METDNGNNMEKRQLGFMPKRKTAIIKVIGVGGGGSNAVNHMFKQGIEGVDFIVCNTDMQALESSPVPVKVQLGDSGLGAGGDPEKAAAAAEESFDNIKSVLDEDTEMLFITAGMGGGTGTGAAPVIARYAHELGLLTVGIVTLPFRFEGRKKWQRAEKGIQEMRKYIDTLLIISNDKLRDYYNDLSLSNAFQKVDNVLTTAAKGIADIITVPGYVNVDFEDVKTVMKQSGKAIMGSAEASGSDRAIKAIEEAMASPLLNDNDITGANKILLYITTGKNDITIDEIMTITNYILEQCGEDAEIIWGRNVTDNDTDVIGVTIIATGFDNSNGGFIGTIDHKVAENVKQTVKTVDNKNDIAVEEKTESPTPENIAINEENTGIDETQSDTIMQQEDENKKTVHYLDDDTGAIEQTEFEFDTSNSNPMDDGDSKTGTGDDSGIQLIKNKKPEIKISNDKEIQTPQLNEKRVSELKETNKETSDKLKNLSMMNSDTLKKNFRELEKEPAYLRKKIQVSTPNYSSDDDIPRLSLGKDSKNNAILKSDANFMHKTID
jgi:cell division protein FtsZ